MKSRLTQSRHRAIKAFVEHGYPEKTQCSHATQLTNGLTVCQKMDIRRKLVLVVMVFVCGGCLLPGCQLDPVDVDLSESESSTSDGQAGKSSIVRRPRYIYGVKIVVLSLRVPIGQFSKNEGLWSYLDEEQVALKSKVLGLNGFRVGVGQKKNLQDVQQILTGMMASKYSESVLQTFNEKPGTIAMQRNTPAKTIFLYSENQTLTGNDYPPGDNLIKVNAVTNPDHRNKSLLTITPEIRSTKARLQMIHENRRPRLQESPVLFLFKNMRFQLKMTDGEFLIIGPGIESRRPTSIGHHFLTSTENNIEYERILVLQPQVVRFELNN